MLIQNQYIKYGYEIIHDSLIYRVHNNILAKTHSLGQLYVVAYNKYRFGFAATILEYDMSTQVLWIPSEI